MKTQIYTKQSTAKLEGNPGKPKCDTFNVYKKLKSSQGNVENRRKNQEMEREMRMYKRPSLIIVKHSTALNMKRSERHPYNQ